MSSDEVSILIVEDEGPIKELLTEILSTKYSCVAVADANEALALLRTDLFHLVLADIGLPGPSGLELTRLITRTYPGIVVVVLSGKTDDESVAEAMAAGAFDYLKKPFNLSRLYMSVELALRYQAQIAAKLKDRQAS